MKGLFNKVRSTPEVLDLLDAAEALELAEKENLEASRIIFGHAWAPFVTETPPALKEKLETIRDHGEKFLLTLKESADERKISPALTKLRQNQEDFTKKKADNKRLQDKLKDATGTAERQKRGVEACEARGEPVALARARATYEASAAAAEAARQASEESDKRMETEAPLYRKNIIDLLTTPLEAMIESRMNALEKGIEFGGLLAAQAAALEVVIGKDAALIKDYHSLNAELAKMTGQAPAGKKPEAAPEPQAQATEPAPSTE
jgi:hypothetical protein